MRRQLILLCCATMLLASCATPPQPASGSATRIGLHLAPADLGAEITLQQHLTVERNGKTDELDTALEVDASELNLVGMALGQRVLTLHYDGKDLTTWRHVLLPAQVRSEDILEDIQLTLWPVDAISKALPPGWRIEDHELQRALFKDDQLICTIQYSTMPRWGGTATLENLRFHYRITIQSKLN
jgi:Protein of unknown function (DUF3261)